MRLMWHIAWKDLCRLRWAILVWLLLIVAKLGAGAFLVWNPTSSVWECNRVILAAKVFIFLEVLMGYLLAAQLIHSDVLTDSKAFWRTRPISSARLFGAKVLGLAVVFGVLPILVTLPWWWVSGYSASDIGRAAVETCLWEFAVVLVAWPLAALTDGMPRFLLWSLVLLVSVMCLVLMGSQMMSGSAALAGSRILVALAVFALTCFISGCVVFWLHRWEEGSALLAFGLVVSVLALGFSPWLLSQPQNDLPFPTGGALSAKIAVEFDRARVDRTQKDGKKVIFSSFTYRGVPNGYFLGRSLRYFQTWEWDDGVKFALKGRTSGDDIALEDDEFSRRQWSTWFPPSAWAAVGITTDPIDGRFRKDLEVKWRERSPKSFRPEVEGFGETTFGAEVLPSLADKMLRHPSNYFLQSSFQLKRLERTGDVTPSVGQNYTSDRQRERILAAKVSTADNRLLLSMSLTRSLIGARNIDLGGIEQSGWIEKSNVAYALVSSEAKAVSSGHVEQSIAAVRIATVGIVRQTVEFFGPGEYLGHLEFFRPRPDWFANLSLVKVTGQVADNFYREARVSDFRLNPVWVGEGKP